MSKDIARCIDDLHAAMGKWVATAATDPSTDFVWSEDLGTFRNAAGTFNIKWLVVGNNPGPMEKGSNNQGGLWIGRYFHPQGKTGCWTRLLVAHAANLKDEVIFLEKSPIQSTNADDLVHYDQHPSFGQSQRYLADLVFRLHRLTGAQVWVQGYTHKVYTPFMDRLRTLYKRPSAMAGGTPLSRSVYLTHHLQHYLMSEGSLSADTVLNLGLAAALQQLPGLARL